MKSFIWTLNSSNLPLTRNADFIKPPRGCFETAARAEKMKQMRENTFLTHIQALADQSCAPHGARGSDCNVMSTALTMKLMSGLPWQLSSGARVKSSQPCTHCILTKEPEGTWGEQECSWTARFGHLQHLVTAPAFGWGNENEKEEPNSYKILIQAALSCVHVPAFHGDRSLQTRTPKLGLWCSPCSCCSCPHNPSWAVLAACLQITVTHRVFHMQNGPCFQTRS